MAKPILYTETTDKLNIQIFPSMKPIVKFGLALQGISFIVFAIGYTIFILSMIQSIGIASLAIIVGAIIYFIIGRMYVRRVFYKEVIEVTKETLNVIDEYPGTKIIKQYPMSEISDLGFAGQRPFTEHPLTGKSTDYLGWGVSEKEVQYVIDDGTIELFYNGATRRFGKNIASWDAEEIISRIERFTEHKFSRKVETNYSFAEQEDSHNAIIE